MAEITWGNPETKAFAKQQLRYATHGEAKVNVNKLIWKLVNRILIGLDQAGLNVQLAVTNEDDPLRISFIMQADDIVMVNQLVGPAMFLFDGKVFRFTGTAAEADALSNQLPDVETLTDDSVSDESTPPELDPETVIELPVEQHVKIGGPVMVGDDGLDVVFIQNLIGRPVGLAFSDEDLLSFTDWQKRHWTNPTGEFDSETLHNILPKRAGWLRPGATGDQIRTLQAAFRALELQISPVNGVWGVRFSQSLRAFQRQRGLQIRSRVGTPEWSSLFTTPDELEPESVA